MTAPASTGASEDVGRPLRASLAASGLIHLTGLVTGVVLARTLGPGDRGELAAALLWFILLTELLSLGVLQAMTFETARLKRPPRTLATTSLALALLLGTAALAIGALLIPAVLSDYEDSTVTGAIVFLASAPFSLGALYLMGELNGLHRYAAFHTLRVLYIAVAAIGLVVLAALDELTVRNAIYCYMAGNVVTFAAALALLAVDGKVGSRPSIEKARRLLRFGIRSHASKVATILNDRLAQLVVAVALGPVDLGLFVVAVTLTSLTMLVGQSTAFVALPAVAGAATAVQRREAGRLLVSFTLIAGALVTIPLLAFTPQIVEVFFGEDFSESAEVARLLLLAAVMVSTNRVLEGVLQGAGRPLDAGVAELIALVLTGIGLAVFLPLLGLTGAGLASLVAYSLSVVVMTRRAARALSVPAASLVVPDRGAPRRLLALLRSQRAQPEVALDDAELEAESSEAALRNDEQQ